MECFYTQKKNLFNFCDHKESQTAKVFHTKYGKFIIRSMVLHYTYLYMYSVHAHMQNFLTSSSTIQYPLVFVGKNSAK